MKRRYPASLAIVLAAALAGGCSSPDDAADSRAAADDGAARAAPSFTYPDGSPHPVTEWGDPDLTGNWPIMHLFATRLQRDPKYGDRRFLTDEEWQAAEPLRAAGLDQVLLAAPTTVEPRLSAVCAATRGFLYYVSFAGITGADRLSLDSVRERVAQVRERSAVPIAVGFGVRDAASAAAIGGFADAVVIGSALVERLAGAEGEAELCARARGFLEPIRAALDGAGKKA
jgi:hypothetical protein